jgi:hypothetical protein
MADTGDFSNLLSRSIPVIGNIKSIVEGGEVGDVTYLGGPYPNLPNRKGDGDGNESTYEKRRKQFLMTNKNNYLLYPIDYNYDTKIQDDINGTKDTFYGSLCILLGFDETPDNKTALKRVIQPPFIIVSSSKDTTDGISVTNEYRSSVIGSALQGMGQTLGGVAQMSQGARKLAGDIGGAAVGFLEGVADTMKNAPLIGDVLSDITKNVGGVATKFMTNALSGFQNSFPNVWSGGSCSPKLGIDLKVMCSLAGNDEDIFYGITLPIAILLALATPKRVAKDPADRRNIVSSFFDRPPFVFAAQIPSSIIPLGGISSLAITPDMGMTNAVNFPMKYDIKIDIQSLRNAVVQDKDDGDSYLDSVANFFLPLSTFQNNNSKLNRFTQTLSLLYNNKSQNYWMNKGFLSLDSIYGSNASSNTMQDDSRIGDKDGKTFKNLKTKAVKDISNSSYSNVLGTSANNLQRLSNMSIQELKETNPLSYGTAIVATNFLLSNFFNIVENIADSITNVDSPVKNGALRSDVSFGNMKRVISDKILSTNPVLFEPDRAEELDTVINTALGLAIENVRRNQAGDVNAGMTSEELVRKEFDQKALPKIKAYYKNLQPVYGDNTKKYDSLKEDTSRIATMYGNTKDTMADNTMNKKDRELILSKDKQEIKGYYGTPKGTVADGTEKESILNGSNKKIMRIVESTQNTVADNTMNKAGIVAKNYNDMKKIKEYYGSPAGTVADGTSSISEFTNLRKYLTPFF